MLAQPTRWAAASCASPVLHACVRAAGDTAAGAASGAQQPATSYPVERIKVVLLENIHPLAVEQFRAQGFIVEHHQHALSGQELVDVAGDAHILGIRSKTQLTKEFFDTVGWHRRRLWAIGCFCIGTNQIDLDAAASVGVPVFNAPFSNTRSVAEKTVAEVVALHRRLFQRSMDMHSGQWVKSAAHCHEVRGRTLGIVGYGRIGSQVSVLAETMGMSVVFYDPLKQLPLGNARQLPTLEEVLSVSDAVTLHVPGTPDTHHMIDEPQLRLMKPRAHLINNARGSVVNLDAAKRALQGLGRRSLPLRRMRLSALLTLPRARCARARCARARCARARCARARCAAPADGRLGGMAVDVFPEEPEESNCAFDCPLRGMPNTILTPHIGGSTEEAQFNIADEVAMKLIRCVASPAARVLPCALTAYRRSVLNNGSTTSAVNFPEVELPRLHSAHHRYALQHRQRRAVATT